MAYLGKTPSQAVRSRYKFNPSAGDTSISGNDADGNTLTFADGEYLDVYLNGVLLVSGDDYTPAPSTNTISSLAALATGDVVEIVVYDTFSLFGGNVKGDLTISNGKLIPTGNIDVSSTAIEGNLVPSADNTYSLGTSTEEWSALHVDGTGHIDTIVSGEVAVDNITIDGNSITSTNTDGNITLNPNGAGDIVLDADVGIGTTSPNSELNIAANNSGQGAKLTIENTDTSITTDDVIGQIDFYANDASANGTGAKVNIKGIATSSAGTLTALTLGTSDSTSATAVERMRIDSSGNVGINQTNPQYKLDIKDSSSRMAFLDSSGSAVIVLDGVNGDFIGSDYYQIEADGSSNFKISKAGTDRLVINTSGNVGIGTSSPSALLHLKSGSSNHVRFSGSSGADYGGWAASDGSYLRIGTWSSGARIQFSDSGDDFKVLTGTGNTTRLTVNSSGNVLIGKTADDNDTAGIRLVSDGHASFSRSAASTAIFNRKTSDGHIVNFRKNQADVGHIGASGGDLYINGSSDLAFRVGDDEKARIDSSGRLGIGTTPSVPLHVVKSGSGKQEMMRIQANDAGLHAFYLYVDDTNNHVYYKSSGSQGGTHIWETGNTEIMRLDTSGHLGIGASPNNTLTVKGGAHQLDIETSATGVTIESIDRAALNDSSDMAYYARHGKHQFFTDAYSERMRITNTGNVGIGTTTPASYDSRANKLVVGGTGDAGITIFSGATSDARLVFAASGDTGLSNGQIHYDNNDDKLRIATGGSDRFAINSSGNVGIGTTSPSSDAIVRFLHINDATSAGIVLDGPEKFSIYSSSSSALVFRNEDTDSAALAIYDNGRIAYKSESSNNIRSTTDMRQGSSKMWAHVNQNGTQGIQDSYNLSSITDNGTGRTLYSISANMGNATYVVSGLNRDGGGYNDNTGMHLDTSTSMGAGSFEIFCHIGSSGNDGIPLVTVHGDLS